MTRPRSVRRWLAAAAIVALALLAGPAVAAAVFVNLGSLAFNRAVMGRTGDAGAALDVASAHAARALAFAPSSDRAHLLAGLADLGRGRHDSAIGHLTRSIDRAPDDVTRHWLAETYDRAGNRSAAVEQWRAAGAEPYLMRQGVEAFRRGDGESARRFFQLAADVRPEGVEAPLQLASLAAAAGQFEEAARWFDEAVARQPASIHAHIARAEFVQRQMRSGERAIATISDSLAVLDPAPAPLLLLRSEAAADIGAFEAAEADARRALAVSPGDVAARLWLGDLYLRQNRHADARAAYQAVLASAPEPSWAWTARQRMGRLHADLGEWEAAAAEFERAAVESARGGAPARSVAHNYVALGQLWLDAGDASRARASFVTALEFDPENVMAARKLASLPAR